RNDCTGLGLLVRRKTIIGRNDSLRLSEESGVEVRTLEVDHVAELGELEVRRLGAKRREVAVVRGAEHAIVAATDERALARIEAREVAVRLAATDGVDLAHEGARR